MFGTPSLSHPLCRLKDIDTNILEASSSLAQISLIFGVSVPPKFPVNQDEETRRTDCAISGTAR